MSESVSQSQKGHLKPRSRRGQLVRLAILCLVLIGCGIVIGAGGAVIIGKKALLRNIRRFPAPQEVANRMKYELDLTDQQVESVEVILSEHMKAIHEIFESGRPRVEEQFNQMNDEIAAVLNDDQAKSWRKHTKNLHEFFRPPKPPGPGDLYNPMELKDLLQLSDEQLKQVQSVLEEHQKKSRDARREIFSQISAKMDPLRQQTDQAIEALLTKEQVKNYRALQEEREKRRDEWKRRMKDGRWQRGGPNGPGPGPEPGMEPPPPPLVPDATQ